MFSDIYIDGNYSKNFDTFVKFKFSLLCKVVYKSKSRKRYVIYKVMTKIPIMLLKE